MKRNWIFAAFLALVLPSNLMVAQQSTHDEKAPHANFYTPADIQWKDGPPALPRGVKFAILEGDPSKEGLFVMRVRIPDGIHIPAHTHPTAELITIIQGAFKVAMGDNPKLADAHSLPTGSFAVLPTGMVHAAWAEGETIVQVSGMGPFIINYVNPADDPRNAKK